MGSAVLVFDVAEGFDDVAPLAGGTGDAVALAVVHGLEVRVVGVTDVRGPQNGTPQPLCSTKLVSGTG